MWRVCKKIAEVGGCVGHDPDYDQIIDFDVDEKDAHGRYNWI